MVECDPFHVFFLGAALLHKILNKGIFWLFVKEGAIKTTNKFRIRFVLVHSNDRALLRMGKKADDTVGTSKKKALQLFPRVKTTCTENLLQSVTISANCQCGCHFEDVAVEIA